MIDKIKFLEALEYFLGISAAIVLSLFVSLKMSNELRDPDIWLHLKTGEYIVQHKSVPHQDIFSSTLSGKVWIDHSWLVQVIFYLIFRIGGPDNLIFLTSFIVVLAFIFLLFSIEEEYRLNAVIISLFFLTVWSSQIRYNIRPENFSILFFSIFLLALTRLLNTRWIFILPLIQLLWVNCHGFFILGPLLVGIFVAGQALKQSAILPWEWNTIGILDRQSYRRLIAVFLLTCLVSFINPYSYEGVLYPLKIVTDFNQKSGIFHKNIVELLPTWEFTKRFHVDLSTYFIFAILSFASFLMNFRSLNVSYLAMWLIFFGISVTVNRNLLFFTFIAFAITSENLINRFKSSKFHIAKKFFKKIIILINIMVLLFIILKIANYGFALLHNSYYIFEENRFKSSFMGISSRAYPEEATDFIIANNLPDNIFNMFNYGSYLIYRVFPKRKVFLDGRTELYGEDFFKDYLKILDVDAETIGRLFKKYKINTVFVSEIGDEKPAHLCKYLFDNPHWVLVYFDKNSFIFLRNIPKNKALINKLKIDLRKWQPPKIDLDKFGLRNIFPEPYLKRAWNFYHLGLFEQATQEVKETLRVDPGSYEAYSILGLIYLRKNLFDLAFENLRLAYIYSPLDDETLKGLGELYLATDKPKPALSIFKILNKSRPNSAEVHYFLGKSYAQTGQIKLAEKSFKEAIKISPNSDNAYKELGILLYQNKEYKEAAKLYKDAIKKGLDYRYFYKRLSALYKKTHTEKTLPK